MSQPPTDSTDDLQFDVIEPTAASGPGPAQPTCIACHRPIVDTYFAIGDRMVCPTCRTMVEAPPPGSAFVRVAKAAFMGLGAGLLGAVVWFALRRFAGVQIGIVAVLVGYLVGKAVKNGSGNRGGRGYQVLAVVLTYACVAANYMPDVYQGLMDARDKAIASDTREGKTPPKSSLPLPVKIVIRIAITFVASLALPIMMASEQPIGLLIIGFALWEAWKFSARRLPPFTGPYRVGGPGVGIAR